MGGMRQRKILLILGRLVSIVVGSHFIVAVVETSPFDGGERACRR
jgi:hypothetical protein